MLQTSSLITEITEVPREWVFEHYLKLPCVLSGQDIKIKSVFSPKDKEPSMFIYHKFGQYRYNDFSSGKKGDNIDLVREMFNLGSRGDATLKIIDDYNKYLAGNPGARIERTIEEHPNFKVEEFEVRGWIKNDQEYWNEYKLGSADLDFFNVKALRSYLLRKRFNGEIMNEITIEARRIYGFFRNDGTLYKIYQPMKPKNKFVKITPYIQGSEQLTYNTEFLVICSSIKDMMCLRKLGFKNIETVAPDSENVLIDTPTIKMYKEKYKNICTILDNDEAGIKAMKKYKSAFGIRGIKIPVEKDIADMVKEHGVDNTRIFLQPMLSKILRG